MKNALFVSVCMLALAAPMSPAAAQSQPVQASATNGVPTTNTDTNRETSATAASANVGPDYLLGAGDKIRIEVYKEPQLSQSLQVRPDGKITLPLVGDMKAAGLTPIQLRDQIGTALKDYVNNPVVTVMVVEALASTVYVMGNVNKAGTLPLTGPTTVLQALAMAGGFTEWAKTGKVKILRNGPNGVTTIPFNYDDAIKGKTPPLYLQRGDTIIVP